MSNIFTHMLTMHRKNLFVDNPNNIVSNNTLSGILQNRIGYVMTNVDPITTKGEKIKSLNDFKEGEIGLFVRYQFDGMNNLTAVPGTYLHNAIFSENPLYNIGDKPSATIVMIKYSDDMFNSLLPGNKIDTFKSLNEQDSDGNIKAFNLKNNAFYCHDSNSCDGRLNQYIQLKDNTIYNSACDNSCNKTSNTNNHTLYAGNTGQNTSETLFCNISGYNIYKNKCMQTLNSEQLPNENCQTGITSNGKGIHIKLDYPSFEYTYDPINPDYYLKAVNYSQETCNDCNNCISKNDNTLGKWSSNKYTEDYNISNKDDINDFYNKVMNNDLYNYSVNFHNKKYIANWIKTGTKNNTDIVSNAQLKLKTQISNKIPDWLMNQCQDRLDLVMPWTDELPCFIHLQNSLYQYYFNFIKNNDGIILSGDKTKIRCKYYWFGWNEVPVINYPLDNGGKDNNDSNLNQWSQTATGDYTLMIYLDDTFWKKNFNINSKIKLQFNSENQSIELANFKECFLNSDNSANELWQYICSDDQIISYIEAFKKNNFNSCNLVFMKQVKLTLKNKMPIFQKVIFDIAPSSVNNTLKINNKITFNWLDSDKNPLKCKGFVYFPDKK